MVNRAHIRVTLICNNDCKFCLVGPQNKKNHENFDKIKIEIDEAIKKNVDRIILSGGEPTIYPQIIDVVKYAKKSGAKHIQIISNGRKFSDFEFTKNILKSGLNEVTISVHGHTAKLHDELTQSKGSFEDLKKGVKNLHKFPSVIVSADTAITKSNYKYLKNIAKFIVNELNIKKDLNLIGTAPYGYAYLNHQSVFPPLIDLNKYISETIDWLNKENVIVWVLRTHPKYLVGNEKYREEPKKIIEEVESRNLEFKQFNSTPTCRGIRCDYCGLNLVCNSIIITNKSIEYNLPPTKTIIDVGFNCNNNCIFCDKKRKGFKSLSQITTEISIAAELGSKEIIFTGGDPSLHSDIFKLIQNAKKKGFKKLTIHSNGRLFISKEFTKKMYDSGLTHAIISIQGSNSKNHNSQTRTTGSFKQTINGIINLQNLGIKIDTFTVINNKNYLDLSAIAKLIKNIGGIEHPRFSVLNPNSFVQKNISLKYGINLIAKNGIIPLIGNITPEIKNVINILGPSTLIYNLPFCCAKNFENNIDVDSFLDYISPQAIDCLNLKILEEENYLKKLPTPYLKNIPLPINFENQKKISRRINPLNFTPLLIERLKIKGLQCTKCTYSMECEGLFWNYLLLKGFKQLTPIKHFETNTNKINKLNLRKKFLKKTTLNRKRFMELLKLNIDVVEKIYDFQNWTDANNYKTNKHPKQLKLKPKTIAFLILKLSKKFLGTFKIYKIKNYKFKEDFDTLKEIEIYFNRLSDILKKNSDNDWLNLNKIQEFFIIENSITNLMHKRVTILLDMLTTDNFGNITNEMNFILRDCYNSLKNNNINLAKKQFNYLEKLMEIQEEFYFVENNKVVIINKTEIYNLLKIFNA